jgi:GT2 family glycosyltransferase
VPPSASVVITSYNRSHLLSRAIESAQCAGKNLEVIVVDDCSSDDTPEVCAQIPHWSSKKAHNSTVFAAGSSFSHRYRTFAKSVIEAMAHGLPIISSTKASGSTA